MVNPIKQATSQIGNIAKDFYDKAKPVNVAKEGEDRQKTQCEAKGGTWDAVKKVCVLPQPTPTPMTENTPKANVPAGTIETSTTPGKQGGTMLGIGDKTYLGQLDKDEINNIAMAEANKLPLGAGNISPIGTAQAMQNDIQRRLKLASQVGQIDIATAQQAEEMGIDWKQALMGGAENIVPNAIGFAAAGAGAGALVGGVGAIPGAGFGAVGGALKGFYQGVSQSVKQQKQDLIGGKSKELNKRISAMKQYSSMVNANPQMSEEMMNAYIMEKSLIRRDYNSLLKEANEDLSLWSGKDGSAELIAYQIYFDSTEPALDMKMQQAILSPDPTRAYISTEDFEE